VPEQRRLQNGVEDAGVAEAPFAGAREVGTRQRPRPFRDVEGEPSQRADRLLRVAIRDGMRIDDDGARQRIVRPRGTQKLCVSRRSIEALIEP
jgi:hypothetical protein